MESGSVMHPMNWSIEGIPIGAFEKMNAKKVVQNLLVKKC